MKRYAAFLILNDHISANQAEATNLCYIICDDKDEIPENRAEALRLLKMAID